MTVISVTPVFAQSDSGELIEGVSYSLNCSGGNLELTITDDSLYESFSASIPFVKRGNFFIVDGTRYNSVPETPLQEWFEDQVRAASQQFYNNDSVFEGGGFTLIMRLDGMF
jgi:hypothetical protein